jgi:hypothetical protein
MTCGLLTHAPVAAQWLLVPMDRGQANHLRAYGLTYWALEQQQRAEWLLNYRGGSFLLPDDPGIRREAALRGVSTEAMDASAEARMRATIASSNMDAVPLERAPRIAIYTPPNSEIWDDAVTMALEYAGIGYETIWDPEVLSGGLSEYEWVHLHHEDFTGQYSKFFLTYGGTPWLQDEGCTPTFARWSSRGPPGSNTRRKKKDSTASFRTRDSSGVKPVARCVWG